MLFYFLLDLISFYFYNFHPNNNTSKLENKMGGCISVGTPENVMIAKHRKHQIQRTKNEIINKNKQLTLLEKQVSDLRKKKCQTGKPVTETQVEIVQFGEDLMIEEEISQISGHQLENLLKCALCEQEYDIQKRIPLMVCFNQHTYCSYCIGCMNQKNQKKCPECRAQIMTGNKNLHLCMLLQNIKKNQLKKTSLSVFHQKAERFKISINPSNKFLGNYKYMPEQDTLIRSRGNSWLGLLFNQILPVEGKFKFTFRVLTSIFNNIQIGLIDLNSKVEEGKMSNKRITYHLYDGKVMSSGGVDQAVTSWKPIGKPTPKGKQYFIEVQVNMDDNEVKWFVDKQLKAQAIMSNYIKYAKAVPYISMYHFQDIIVLNAEQ